MLDMPLRLAGEQISKLVKLDPESEPYFAQLDATIFEFAFTLPLKKSVFVTVKSGCLALSPKAEKPADATFTGSPLDFISILTSDSSAQSSNVKVSGSTHKAELLFQWLKKLDIDHEEFLAKLVGDELTYFITSPIKQLVKWKKKSVESLLETSGEYLKFEANKLPAPTQVANFNEQIDALSADLGRLEARIKRLQTQ